MPALANPRHEAFAQAIFKGLTNGHSTPHSNGRAYAKAGYAAKTIPAPGRHCSAADAAASRLLKIVKPISERVAELQQQAADNANESAAKIVAELNQVKREAHTEKQLGAAVSAILGKAKVLGLIDKPQANGVSFHDAQSMQDIGRKLLQSVGFAVPDDASVQEAIEANDVMVSTLLAIYKRAQGTIEQG